MNLNRAARRKRVLKIANEVVKGRAEATAKPQYGLGLVITNRMLVIMFWRWTWTLWDRRRA